ncbi:HAD family hydrolase [Candidatus Methylopumilus planktonicus]|uniref:HAD family hydrolase n=1 Tax=Candidatus Methylopumilus planktonicus TaxID=1581557 RepID=UPI0011228651|nr:HAD family hydrolase [Candidatus Methylopumilus planktonicus]QDD07037.1 HAD family hydrolase [Candidatus Methylopumilus planktonicus]QDD08371.1 HAD family hydrolase [Candidatus Methylopumilus planktonicus]QDD09697.1 HAD family hydrolase [Candidatus Methylopumilus planktonicus]
MMKAVLFDLDGTLIDSAPQLVRALNQLRQQYDLPPIPFLVGRPYASHGAAGLLKAGFNMDKNDPLFDARVQEFLDIYKEVFNLNMQCMEGIEELINTLNFRKISWGIMTNKAKKFAQPIVSSHPLLKSAACLIAGDDVSMPKPSPEGLIKASQMLLIEPSDIIYLGDDRRDVMAANDAGMVSMAARYGYLEVGDDAKSWGAQHIIDKPSELLDYLNL